MHEVSSSPRQDRALVVHRLGDGSNIFINDRELASSFLANLSRASSSRGSSAASTRSMPSSFSSSVCSEAGSQSDPCVFRKPRRCRVNGCATQTLYSGIDVEAISRAECGSQTDPVLDSEPDEIMWLSLPETKASSMIDAPLKPDIKVHEKPELEAPALGIQIASGPPGLVLNTFDVYGNISGADVELPVEKVLANSEVEVPSSEDFVSWIGQFVETDKDITLSYLSATGLRTVVARGNIFKLGALESKSKAWVEARGDFTTKYSINPNVIRKLANG